MKTRVLLVDDDLAMREMLAEQLSRRGFDPITRASPAEAQELLRVQDVDVVVADYRLPGTTGIALCDELGANRPDLPVLVITAFGSMETAIAAIRAGAYDFLPKPFDIEQLVLALERAVAHGKLKAEVHRLRLAVSAVASAGAILGQSAAVRRMKELIARASPSEATVLITGESGTGKDLVARALHEASPRNGGPFVALNCAAVAESLLESELFGHKRGAFTDARENRAGLMVQAKGGTLFLDEIGDMPPAMQSKLLRVIETRSVRAVGSDTETPIDVRFVAASHRDLESDAEEGRFRHDLFFRINVIQIPVPPLRTRGTDVLLLAQHFLAGAAERSGKPVVGLSPSAAERLLAYDWPGNVRELQNAVERAVALCAFDKITEEDLPERIRTHRRSQLVVAADDPETFLPLHEIERRYVLHVLASVSGNKSAAARVLGLDRRTMYRMLERFNGQPDDSEHVAEARRHLAR